MNKFIIACLPRTGSYRLVDILNQQEGVVCHGEVFKKTGIELNDEYLKEVSLTEEDIKRRDADPASFMGELFGAAEKK
ncbi:hypothetical protein A8U91_00985 [Halomonas elongata]|uniref:Stf0 sulfotransferase n=1 Tax=Halomonas elongata TaxID=2746 RepID=A0A1B8P324_HALEL|nr:hypothetical protein [Halomonas elongata]OBX36642.1 hypothetical protein A8U91_00985 [Halomonas elongata]